MTTQSPADARDQFEIAYATHIKSTPESIRALRQGEGYFDGCCTYLKGAWWAWQFLSNAPDAYSPSYKKLYEDERKRADGLMAFAVRLQDERAALSRSQDVARVALQWTAGTLQEIVSGRWKGAKESDKVSIGSVTKTVAEVLDMADAALAAPQFKPE